MRGWLLGPSFGIDHLNLQPLDPQPLDSEQVRLRIRAVSLNYRDLLLVEGKYNPRQPLPLVPCSDAAGEVIEVGTAVSRFKVGQKVCPIFAQEWLSGSLTRAAGRSTLGSPLPGTLRQEAVLHQQGLVLAPDHLSWEEAACLPCAGVTAWNALFGVGALSRPGDRLLVLGTGGVSVFAIQFARMAGLRVAVTSSSNSKLAKARQLGAELTVNYREQPDWFRPVLEWSQGEGVDKVVEVGGASTLPQSLRCLRPGGQICLIGILGGHELPLDVRSILMSQISVQGVLVGHRESFEAMNRAMTASQICPHLDRVFPFSEAPEALIYMKSAQHFGKIVVAVD